MRPIPLSIREHTAQLSKKEAAQVQQEFIKGEINVLSCTTTFEMGVDVGDLQVVFLRNIPPNPGNYAQRSGRAGRRSDTAAVIVSFAQRRTHDLSYYSDWRKLVTGAVRPPSLRPNNVKIIRRHIHAEALAEFYRNHPKLFEDKLKSLFNPAENKIEEIIRFLADSPQSLKERLKRIVPPKLYGDLGLEEWAWLTGSNLDEKHESFVERLHAAAEDVKADWKILFEAEEEASQQKQHKKADIFQRQLNTLKERPLLGKLGTYGLMPKYGFPTEVVELKVRSESHEAMRLELQRDLKLALSEFAPDNQLIANGKGWTSQGIVLPSGERKLHEYRYFHCSACMFFEADKVIATEEEKEEGKDCHCGSNIKGKRYIFPEFGFTTAMTKGEEIGEERPPLRSYAQSFFQQQGEEGEYKPLPGLEGVSARENRQGWIHVINDNRDRGFFYCASCGYATSENPHFQRNAAPTHKKPWRSDDNCNAGSQYMQRRSLGFRYKTDVLQLLFLPKSVHTHESFKSRKSLWLSLLYSLLQGACRTLEIEERDIGGCLYFSRRDHPSLVLFDAAPGGAGFVWEINEEFHKILEAARKLLDCGSCAEDSSCINCLRTYYNQRDHNRLNRGLALSYLKELL